MPSVEPVAMPRFLTRRALLILVVLFGFFLLATIKTASSPWVGDVEQPECETPQPVAKQASLDVSSKTEMDSSSDSACPVGCAPEFPCQYQQEVDFRIIVITMDRPDSLKKCLKSVSQLNILGDKVHVNIWIDRFKSGKVDEKTLKISEQFADNWQNTWKKGSACVTVQPRNAYIHLQWVHTWRPRNNTKEIAVILEDDVDVSPLMYKWLKLAHQRYDDDFRVTGYAVQGQNLISFGSKNGKRKELQGRKTDTTFYWRFMKTWGFSPNAQNWRYFQEWYAKNRWDPKVKPYVPDSITTGWYKGFEKQGKEASHWEQWHHYYSTVNKFYCVYNNFAHYTGAKWLASNRMEKGLHFGKPKHNDFDDKLLTTWKKEYEVFPSSPVHLDIFGDEVKTL